MFPRPKNSNQNPKDKKVDKTVLISGIAVLFILVVLTSIVTPNNPELGYKFFAGAFIFAFVFVVIRRIIIIVRRVKRHEKGYDEKGRWV